jgi:pimeloyl-ACP methyl ester carboxylesterase
LTGLLLLLLLLLQFGTLALDVWPWLGLLFGLAIAASTGPVMVRTGRDYDGSWPAGLSLFAAGLACVLGLSLASDKATLQGARGRYHQPHETFWLRTADGERLSALKVGSGHPTAVVIAPGLAGRKDQDTLIQLAEALAADHDVFIFDLRGHLRSSGRVDAEVWRDVEAAINHAWAQGYQHVYGVGLSLGSIALVEAARQAPPGPAGQTPPCFAAPFARGGKKGVERIVLLSSVAQRATLEAARDKFASPLGRLWLRLRGIRVHPRPERHGVRSLPPPPGETIGELHVPVLIIHGTSDLLFPQAEAQLLYENAPEPKDLLLLPNAGHGDRLLRKYPAEVYQAIRGWLMRDA